MRTTIAKHLELLVEAELIKGVLHQTDEHGVYFVDVDRLTWQGHEFLDSARSKEDLESDEDNCCGKDGFHLIRTAQAGAC
jgi:Hypothetical protein (DUF2513)